MLVESWDIRLHNSTADLLDLLIAACDSGQTVHFSTVAGHLLHSKFCWPQKLRGLIDEYVPCSSKWLVVTKCSAVNGFVRRLYITDKQAQTTGYDDATRVRLELVRDAREVESIDHVSIVMNIDAPQPKGERGLETGPTWNWVQLVAVKY